MNNWVPIYDKNQPTIGQDILVCALDRFGEPHVKAITFYGWGTLDADNITNWCPMPEPPTAEKEVTFEERLKAELRKRGIGFQKACEVLGLKYGAYNGKMGELHKRTKEEIELWADYLKITPEKLVKGTDLELSYKGGKDTRTVGYTGDLGKTITENDIEIMREYANCNMVLAEVARKHFLHRSTAEYHLDKIKRVSGYNPYCFWDLVKLLGVYGIKR